MLGQIIHQLRVFDCCQGVSDALGVELVDGLPYGGGSGDFTGVDSNMPTGLAGTLKMFPEQVRRKICFITGQVEGFDMLPLAE